MFELVEATAKDADGYMTVVVKASGLAPVHDLANACAAAAWHELKQIGLEITERTGVRIQPEVLDLNAQIENWKHLRAVADERNRLESEELRRLADANEGSYPLGAYETARRLRRILSGEYVREAMREQTRA